MDVANDKLKDLLLKSRLMTDIELTKIERIAEDSGVTLADYLLSVDVVAEDAIGQIIGSLINVPFINLKEITIPPDVIQLLPEQISREYMVVAFSASEDKVKVALMNPLDKQLTAYLKNLLGKDIEVFFGTPDGIQESFRLYQQHIIDSLNVIVQENLVKEAGGQLHRFPIVKIVDLILDYAYRNHVSDIHLQPYDNQLLIRFRIDGILHDILLLPKDFHQKIINRIKIVAQIRTYEVGKFQDGRFRFTVDDAPTDVRVSIIPAMNGEKAVLRYLSRKNREIQLEEMGFLKDQLQIIKRGFSRPYGMILATGPTGSGKTTTLYGILKKLNRREVNISTIEDPVEFQIPEITQIQVDAMKEITFAKGLRSLLRQDPNIIMVGEIRDQETASIAVNAALTGHLLLSTLHTNDAATVMPRLLDMGIEPFLIASTVNIILAQRLVRKTCRHCQTSEEISYAFLSTQLPKKILDTYFGKKEQITFYKGVGCSSCQGTGYIGRSAICEVMEVTKEIQDAVVGRQSADDIKALAQSQGMKTMLEDGIEKVQRGLTTIEEVLRVAKE
ncbi:MAG: GspE/PulE family protein [bacterium]